MSTLRAALEAAVEQVESNPTPATAAAPEPSPAPTPAPATPASNDNNLEGAENKPTPTPAPPPDEASAAKPEEGEETPAGEEPDKKLAGIDVSKPPVSWKPAAKAKWDQVPVEARIEAHRRDREVTVALSNSAQARQFHQRFAQTVQPFEAHIRSRGVDAMQAFEELIKADYLLSTAPAPKRAQFMAMLIKDYGIDLHALDSALAGQPAADPVESKVQALLEQRLAPIQKFLQSQAQTAQQSQQTAEQKLQEQIQQMAADAEKFPHFESVREDMADLIDLQAKRGVYLTLEQAYTRAVAINPELSSQEARKAEETRQRQAAAAAHARAAKAKAASVSVSGAPNGTPNNIAAGKNDLRGTIEAALNQATGR